MTPRLAAEVLRDSAMIAHWLFLRLLTAVLRPLVCDSRLIAVCNALTPRSYHPRMFDSRDSYVRHYSASLSAYERLLDPELWLRGRRVLDLGCGLGQYSDLLRRSGAVVVAGVDSQPGKLAWAVQRGFLSPGEAILASAEALPFPDAAFDTVFSHTAFEHFPRVDAVLREVRRVLRPGGLLIAGVNFIHHEGGHHLFPYIRFPWPLGLFPERELCRYWSLRLRRDRALGLMGFYEGHGEVECLDTGDEIHLNQLDYVEFERRAREARFSTRSRLPSGALSRAFPGAVARSRWSRELTGTVFYALAKEGPGA